MDKNKDLAGHNLLITRSKAHFRVIVGSYETKSTSFCKKNNRNEKYGLFYKTHKNGKYLTSCSECLPFPLQDSLPNGQLLTKGQVFSYCLTVNKEHSGKYLTDVASYIILHWMISCNIYTMTCRSVANKLEVIKKHTETRKVSLNQAWNNVLHETQAVLWNLWPIVWHQVWKWIAQEKNKKPYGIRDKRIWNFTRINWEGRYFFLFLS